MKTQTEIELRNKIYAALYRKFAEIRPIIKKRKSAFGCYEWLKLVEVLNIDEK